jgi:hypothetical protein
MDFKYFLKIFLQSENDIPVFRHSGVPAFRHSGVPAFLLLLHAMQKPTG